MLKNLLVLFLLLALTFQISFAQEELSCNTAANEIDADIGTSVAVTCPSDCDAWSLWGTELYTDDSPICSAAAHSGLINLAEGGSFFLNIEAGQASYAGTYHNGLVSNDYGEWERSYSVSSERRGGWLPQEQATNDAFLSPDWSTGSANNARTRYNAAEQTLTPPLELLWEQHLENYYVGHITAQDALLALSGYLLESQQVRLLDAENGENIWSFDLKSNVEYVGEMGISATFGSQNIYFGGQSDDNFYAVDIRTGDLVWDQAGYSPNGELGTGFFESDIALIDDYVLIPNDADISTIFDAETGEIIRGSVMPAWAQPLAVHNNIAFVFRNSRTSLSASEVDTGDILWEIEGLQGDYSHWLIAGEKRLYTSISPTEVAALDELTGEVLWMTSFNFYTSRAALAGDYYLFTSTFADENNLGRVIALDAATGTNLWEFEAEGEGVISLAFANDVLYLLSVNPGILYALAPATGELLWSSHLDGYGTDLVIANGNLYATTASSEGLTTLYAFGSAR